MLESLHGWTPPFQPARLPGAALAALACALTIMPGCSGSKSSADRGPEAGSLRALSSREGSVDERVARMREAWAIVSQSSDRPAARQRLKDVAWSAGEAFEVRGTAVELLASDPDPAGVDDARELVKLLLPREKSRGMVAMLSRLCVDKGWQDVTPALVRSYSRVVDAVEEGDRAERWALAQLNPGASLFDLAFGVFLDPRTDPGPPGANFDQRTRADAWVVIARLDPTGAERRRLLASAPSGAGESPDVRLMRRCAAELAALPDSAAEIAWTQSLFADADAQNTAWRAEVAPLVARLSDAQRARLALRHLECVRWAGANQPDWLARSRDELLSEMAGRLADRPNFQRRVERDQEGGLPPEGLADWRDTLSWGDALTLLVLDTVIVDPAFIEPLWLELDQDRADRTTEYGGLIQFVARAGGVRPLLFVPRSAARQGDLAFPEPEDMIRQGDRALAAFHFHASQTEMLDHAGPSAGDMRYAMTTGRNCLVFTSLRTRRLAVDYYTPSGAIIDLGEIPR